MSFFPRFPIASFLDKHSINTEQSLEQTIQTYCLLQNCGFNSPGKNSNTTGFNVDFVKTNVICATFAVSLNWILYWLESKSGSTENYN